MWHFTLIRLLGVNNKLFNVQYILNLEEENDISY